MSDKRCGRCCHWQMCIPDNSEDLCNPAGSCSITGEDTNGDDVCAFFEARGMHRALMTKDDIAREQTRH
jgi:hypothetical protein